MPVPLLDLKAQYQPLASALEETILHLMEEQKFILGEPVERLERQVAEMLGVQHAIGCANGTDALLLSLKALDILAGDEVITTPFTFFATAGAIHNVGAKPVFVDIEPGTFNLDPAAAEAAITERTRAMIPVDLFGQMAEMEEFRSIADRHRLAIVEDAAQAIGAKRRLRDGRSVTTGTLSDTCTFSFFPSKNLGGFGDGGMVVTNDSNLARRLFRLRVHGGTKTYHHEEVGFNSRLDALQAAVLSVKLPHLESWSQRRRENAHFYDSALGEISEIVTPLVLPENESIYNQYTIRVLDGRRDELQNALKEKQIGSAIYYPVPLHLQECFTHLGYRPGSLPESELASQQVLSLPIYPELAEQQREEVVAAIRTFFGV